MLPEILVGVSDPSLDFDWFGAAAAWFGGGVLEFYLVCLCLYVPCVFLGQRVMRDRAGWSLTGALGVWNALLSVLSGWAAWHVVPAVLRAPSLCSTEVYFQADVGVYIFLFCTTKVFEWVDTLFLVLRKRPVGFLHWFHHVATAAYCLHRCFFVPGDGTAAVFCAMNLVVHFVMYGYYALTSVGWRALRNIGWVITIMQTLQMFGGIFSIGYALSVCPDSWGVMWHGHLLGLSMYLVYLYLFSKLVIRKCSSSGGDKHKKA